MAQLNIEPSPSGKAQDFDSCTRGFESRRLSQNKKVPFGAFLFLNYKFSRRDSKPSVKKTVLRTVFNEER